MPEAGFDPEVAGGALAAGARPAPGRRSRAFAANRGAGPAAGVARGGPIAAAHRGTRPWSRYVY